MSALQIKVGDDGGWLRIGTDEYVLERAMEVVGLWRGPPCVLPR